MQTNSRNDEFKNTNTRYKYTKDSHTLQEKIIDFHSAQLEYLKNLKYSTERIGFVIKQE